MALIGSRASFTNKVYGRCECCSECGGMMRADHVWLVSVRNGRVHKRVCSEECRLKFDHEYWQAVARERRTIQ